jgi:fatty-acyl-CoA synthase
MILGYQFLETYRQFGAQLNRQPRLIYAGDERAAGIDFWADLVGAKTSVPPSPPIRMDDPACIMYTSGTTGRPKGAVMTHRNIFANARNAGVHMGYRERDVTLIVVPLFHVTGLNSQLVAFFYVGGTSVIMRAYNTTGLIELLAKHRVSTMITVPV